MGDGAGRALILTSAERPPSPGPGPRAWLSPDFFSRAERETWNLLAYFFASKLLHGFPELFPSISGPQRALSTPLAVRWRGWLTGHSYSSQIDEFFLTVSLIHKTLILKVWRNIVVLWVFSERASNFCDKRFSRARKKVSYLSYIRQRLFMMNFHQKMHQILDFKHF